MLKRLWKKPVKVPEPAQEPAYERFASCFHEFDAIRDEMLALPFQDESLKKKFAPK